MEQLNQLLPNNQDPLTFEDWYKTIYPKHVEKLQAEKEWNKLTDKEKHLATIDPPLRLANHAQWKDKQMIPSPRRYLLRKLWTDEIIKKRTKEQEQEQNEDGTIHSRLWTMLVQMYGNRFTASYGLTMPKAWVYGLNDLTQIEVSKILRYLATDTSEFIPDLPKINRIRNIGREFWEPEQKLIGNPTKEETIAKHKQDMEKIKSGQYESNLTYAELRGDLNT